MPQSNQGRKFHWSDFHNIFLYVSVSRHVKAHTLTHGFQYLGSSQGYLNYAKAEGDDEKGRVQRVSVTAVMDFQ